MIYVAGLLSTIAWIWLIVIAFKSNSIVWGIVMILFIPATLLFGLIHWDKAKQPFILLLVSIALMFMVPMDQWPQAAR